MEMTVIKDILFDLINESDELNIINIAWICGAFDPCLHAAS